MLHTILVVILILLLIGLLPLWPHSVGWGLGYAPSGVLGLILLVLVVLLLTGRL